MAQVGPLLRSVLQRIDRAADSEKSAVMSALGARFGFVESNRIPAVLQCGLCPPRDGEGFEAFRDRIETGLQPVNDALTGGEAEQLILANGLSSSFGPEQIGGLADLDSFASIELNPLRTATLMDETIVESGAQALRATHPHLRGTGVRLAVLDTGIDLQHPFLTVADSVSTCGEDVAIPGVHGTHCAGAVAGHDEVFAGIAPDVTLLNIKVLRHDNRGTPTNIAKGVDAALALGAEILSISLGFNQLPVWSNRGHGWSCPDGNCVLCASVDNAARLGAIVVTAAGNEHQRAEALRRFGAADSFGTELTCPGHAREAITVGAISKASHIAAEFSSRGPTAYGADKPMFCCTGVNVTSCVPAPRDANGMLLPDPARADLFAEDSGTSMATPVVAGAIALVLQDLRDKGLDTSRAAVLAALRSGAVKPLGLPQNVVGLGRIDLSFYP